jgi:hypothetical protein
MYEFLSEKSAFSGLKKASFSNFPERISASVAPNLA